MSSLFDALTIARSGVLTQQDRLSVISNNIANVDTDGYHRQRADLGTNPPNDTNLYSTRAYELGTGVHMIDVTRAFDDMREGVYLGQNSSLAMHTQLADSLSDLQAMLQGDEGSSLGTCLNNFWAAWQDVANNADNLTMRNVLLERAGTLAERFNIVAERFDEYRAAIADNSGGALTGSVPDAVETVNDLATRIQDLNERIARASGSGSSVNDMADRRDALIRQLSGKISMTLAADKTISIDGQVLVSGDGSVCNTLTVTGTDPVELTLNGAIIHPSGGSIGGWVQVADIIDTLRTNLDSFANELVTQINTLHTTGYDLDGNQGEDFFTGSGAADIQVNSTLYNPANPLLNQPRLVAAALTRNGPGEPNTGDGSAALTIADLADDKIAALDNQTFNNYSTELVGTLAASIESEQATVDDGKAVVNALDNAIQSETGVSLDEEMMEMISAQRAYQAAARLLTTIDDMIQTLINQTG
jgi:flagellar hook-associated protein 1